MTRFIKPAPASAAEFALVILGLLPAIGRSNDITEVSSDTLVATATRAREGLLRATESLSGVDLAEIDRLAE